MPVFDRRIHVIGMGNVGRFMAHALRGIPNPPPVTLIFHKPQTLKEWNEGPQEIRIKAHDAVEARSGFEAELAVLRRRFHGQEVTFEDEDTLHPSKTASDESSQSPKQQVLQGESTEPIHALIVCVKTTQVLSALSSVRHRITPHSVVLFLQNGMGTIDEVNEHIFPDPSKRPFYMLGINSHGVNSQPNDPFAATHAGQGTLSLGLLPHTHYQPQAPYAPRSEFRPTLPSSSPSGAPPSTPKHPASATSSDPAPGSPEFPWTALSRYLLRTLLRTPVLCATSFSPPDLLMLRLEKLAVNSIINPLTVLLDARNGAVLYNYALTRVMRLLLAETSLVLRALPELQHIPGVVHRFDPGRLETLVVGVASKTRENVSSMLADVRAGRRTEVEYMNGWVVRRGEEMGVRCVMNFMIKELVKGKQGMVQWELGEDVPLVGLGSSGTDRDCKS